MRSPGYNFKQVWLPLLRTVVHLESLELFKAVQRFVANRNKHGLQSRDSIVEQHLLVDLLHSIDRRTSFNHERNTAF